MDYRTGFKEWRGPGGGLASWTHEGCAPTAQGLALDPAGAERRAADPPGSAAGESAPGGASGCLAATAESPEFLTSFPFAQAIPSWNARTSPGTWLEVSLRARRGDRTWTKWYSLGVWAEDGGTLERRSVEGQDDEDASVRTDTLEPAFPCAAVQARVRLCAVDGASPPELLGFSLAWSGPKPLVAAHAPGNPGLWGRVLENLPLRSQMVYPDGGQVWCSPTCLSMVLDYWSGAIRPDEVSVREAVAGVWDRVYGGHGNWSFNAAWAGARGLEARVARFDSLARLEPWIAAGVPLILSLSWNDAAGRPLAGAPIGSSRGHLTLLAGFDAAGDPVMNEPAASGPDGVRRTYRRLELEARWLEGSGGTAYVVHPRGWKVPALA